MTRASTIQLVTLATLAMAAAAVAATVGTAFATKGVVISESGVVGGDFLAFYTAGEAVVAGDASSTYDQTAFDAALKRRAPLDQLGMMWQYPPTFFLVIAALPILPYKASYLLWMIAGFAGIAAALSRIGFRGRGLWLLAASPLCTAVLSSGQVSLLTGALLALAAYRPTQRWLVAGVAAGLLTVKPQLGLLIPIVFACAGAWRAFAVAAATAVALGAASLGAFGADAWTGFAMAVARLNADVTGAALNTPPHGMTTLFSQLRLLGVPTTAALTAQYCFAAGVAATVAVGWLRSRDDLGRAAILCAGALLVTPYAYSYEMTALLLPAAYLARGAVGETGLTGVGLYLAASALAVVTSSLVPASVPIQIPFVVCVSGFALVARTLLANGARPPVFAAIQSEQPARTAPKHDRAGQIAL